MRPKSIVLLVLALGCGLVASIGINQVLANRDSSPDAVETVPVFVALKDIGIGDPLKAENLKIEEWPKDKIPPTAITRLEDTENRRAATKIFPGEPLLEAKLLPKGETGASVVDYVPKGMRLVPIRVDDVTALGGLIKPGDRVDLLVTLREDASKGIGKSVTKTFLQNVKVQAINDIFRRDVEGGQSTPVAKTVSLLVTPAQAEIVTFAADAGTIRMILRNTNDEESEDTGGATGGDLLGSPQTAQKTDPDGGKHLLDMLNQQRTAQPEPPAPVAAAPPADHWKMVLLEGPNVRQVEFQNGVPVGLDAATAPETPVTPLPPVAPDDPPPTKDKSSGDGS